MSTFSDQLETQVDKIVRDKWSIVDGRVVPESEGLTLGNDGVRLKATMLYADLADSTEMAMANRNVTAEVYKAFLLCCSRIIRLREGEIRSFDGDRVMGVFLGDHKNTDAAKTALHIKWAFTKIIVPKFSHYNVFQSGTVKLKHSVGIDTSEVLVARAGIRDNNDLVWVGRAPNIAAKLSAIREVGYDSYMTKAVFDAMRDEAKFSDGRSMWEKCTWTAGPAECKEIYRSSWTWSL
jgi:class 3 adenylate cyclase